MQDSDIAGRWAPAAAGQAAARLMKRPLLARLCGSISGIVDTKPSTCLPAGSGMLDQRGRAARMGAVQAVVIERQPRRCLCGQRADGTFRRRQQTADTEAAGLQQGLQYQGPGASA